ncbi:MAG: rhodanese-like domain-containing protein [Corynebacterium sp.]|nr:rhodanese-like domain-containing protein [Corynebacterium sp.]
MKHVQPNQVPEGAQLIDVREQHEWDVEHAAGATHIPMSEITERLAEIDTTRDIYVICRSGKRSEQVSEYLEQSQGWAITNVLGGTEEWKAQGLPLIKIDSI